MTSPQPIPSEADANKTTGRHVCLIVAVVVLLGELLAFIFLKLGLGVSPSIGIAVGVCAVLLTWPWLVRGVFGSWALFRVVLRATANRLMARRSWQFSLRTLLLAVVPIACLYGWYGHRLQAIRQELDFLEGKWRQVREDGTPVVLPDGTLSIVDFNDGKQTVDPNHEPKWLDIHVPGMSRPFKCIYRVEGERLHVLRVSPGLKRPTSFEVEPSFEWEPSFKRNPAPLPPVIMIWDDFWLERVPEEQARN